MKGGRKRGEGGTKGISVAGAGAAQPGRIEARLGAAAQAMGPADAQQETAQQQWRAAVSNLQALIDAAPMALAAAYAGPEGRRRLAGIEPGVPRLHFGSHKVLSSSSLH